jgi:hypothetical protein
MLYSVYGIFIDSSGKMFIGVRDMENNEHYDRGEK